MNNESIKIYDIVRQFGAAGLKKVLKHFHQERKEVGDDTDADYCLEDVLMNTQLLTYGEYMNAHWNEKPKDHKILLDNNVYVLIEVF